MADVDIPGPVRPDPLPPDLAALYPEVALAGSLVPALRAELRRNGFDLPVLSPAASGWRHTEATVGDDHRHVSILLGIEERWFLQEFWERGVMMASGKTTELATAAGAIGLWQSGNTLRELHAAWPYVYYGELAEAYEHGDPVETKWRIYRQTRARHIDHDLIEAAYAQPRLRVLFPGTSHETLLLSRCTRPPFTRDLPAIKTLRDGRYEVAWLPNAPHGPRQIALVDSAQEATALVVTHLPEAGCGPAIDGTAQDLGQN